MEHIKQRTTSFQSICLVILRLVRAESSYSQAKIADKIGETTSSLSKIESGNRQITFELLLRLAKAMDIPMSIIIMVAEKYSQLMEFKNDFDYNEKWSVLYKPLLVEEDDLLKLTNFYFENFYLNTVEKIGECIYFNTFILNTPCNHPNGYVEINKVFRFAIEPKWREDKIKGELKPDDNFPPIK